jgi:hypothetical protein
MLALSAAAVALWIRFGGALDQVFTFSSERKCYGTCKYWAVGGEWRLTEVAVKDPFRIDLDDSQVQ